MTKLLVRTIALLAGCIGLAFGAGENCKADYVGKDPISKKQIYQWEQVVSSTGLLSAALMDNDVTFTVYIGRSGDTNYISIMIRKAEENLARAAFESHYHAAKGDRFILGFKEGEPLSFVATDVVNEAKAGDLSSVLNMTAIWALDVSDADMAAMREQLTTKQVDAVRITVASGQIDQPVADRNGLMLRDKFVCFYETLGKLGVRFAAAPNQTSPIATSTVTKPEEAAKPATVGPTVDQIIKMVAAKVPDDLIIKSIHSSGAKYAPSPEDLIKLKAAGASDEVLRAMFR